jgi:hypothetical protein
MRRGKKRLFDHLVGAREDRLGDGETKCLGRLEVDYELEFGGLPDRKVSWVRTLEDLLNVGGSAGKAKSLTRPQFVASGKLRRSWPAPSRPCRCDLLVASCREASFWSIPLKNSKAADAQIYGDRNVKA